MPVDVTTQFSGMSNDEIAAYFNTELSNGKMTSAQANTLVSQLAANGIIISKLSPTATLYGRDFVGTINPLNTKLELPKSTRASAESAETENLFKLFAKSSGATETIGTLSVDDIGIVLMLMGQEGRNDFIAKMQKSLDIAKEAHRTISESISKLQKQIATEQAAVLEEQKGVEKVSKTNSKIGFWLGVAGAAIAVTLAATIGGPLLVVAAVCAVVCVLTSVASKGLEAKAKGETGIMASIGKFTENTVGVATKDIAGLVGIKFEDEASAAETGLSIIGITAAIVGACCSFGAVSSSLGALGNASKLQIAAQTATEKASFVTALGGVVSGCLGTYVGVKNYQIANLQHEIDSLNIQKSKIEMSVEVMEKTITMIKDRLNDFIKSLLDIEKLVSEESQQKSNTHSEIIRTI